MARRPKQVKKREILPDPLYNSKLVTRFVNRVMISGKKSTAYGVIYGAIDILKQKTSEEDAIKTFELALSNVGPKLEVKARRVGGANYQVPQEVRGERKVALAIRWIIAAAEKLPNRDFKTFSSKLAEELLLASKNEGEAIKKRDTVHKMADANRAFAHFRF